MMMAPAEGSFGSAARACAASSGVRDSARAGFAGRRADSVSFGADASGVIGDILSSDGETSLKGCDDSRLLVVTVSVAQADNAKPATMKHIPSDRMMLTLLYLKRLPKLLLPNSRLSVSHQGVLCDAKHKVIFNRRRPRDPCAYRCHASGCAWTNAGHGVAARPQGKRDADAWGKRVGVIFSGGNSAVKGLAW